MLDEARWQETLPFGACLTFGSMRDMLLPARLPFEQNVRCTPSTCVSNTRKRETRVLGARLPLGRVHKNFRPDALSHSAVALSLATYHPQYWPQSTPPPCHRPQSTLPPQPHPRSASPLSSSSSRRPQLHLPQSVLPPSSSSSS
jgi:hypothetical protein